LAGARAIQHNNRCPIHRKALVNMMKSLKIILIILAICWLGVLGWFVVPYLSGGAESASNQVPEGQVITVQRGDLRIDITAVGNLALSHKEDLAFEMAGDVEEVLVEEGEVVEEGQLLARLDTSAWESELATLERSVLTARTSYLNAIVALEQAESLTPVASLEIQARKDELEQAWDLYWEALTRYAYEVGGTAEADLLQAAEDLRTAEAALANTMTDPAEIEVKELQVQLADANLKNAERELAEAFKIGPEVKAPFAGFVTNVNVEGGDEIKRGTVAVSIADPTEFEADILVSEMDILQVKLGGKAWVQVDAVPGLMLPAKATHISPTATIQQGVVNYKVKVEIEPLKPEHFQLREGLTVTVSILVDERSDVLLVPNKAITLQGKETLVQVVKGGVIEERSIKTGISNWQFTEVTDGLSEGEKVFIPEITTTPTQRGVPLLPGGMGPH